MPTIKLNANGDVILKNGSPSCTCCGPCSPDVLTVYVEYYQDTLPSPTTSYFTLTGSLNAGLFEDEDGNLLRWNGPSESPNNDQWVFVPVDFPIEHTNPLLTRCDPEGVLSFETFTATISFTPLP
jgi:hypothetical protein